MPRNRESVWRPAQTGRAVFSLAVPVAIMIGFLALSAAFLVIAGCGAIQVGPQAEVPEKADIRRVAPREAERLYSIMVPLLRNMDNPLEPRQVRVGIIDDGQINAANAGGGNFYVTTG